MATATKKSETDKPTEVDALEAILTKLGDMEERITEMETRSSTPPKLFANVEAPVRVDVIPEGTRVKLRDTAEKHIALMSRLGEFYPDKRETIESEGVLGTITDNFYENKKTGNHKYRVRWDVVGSWGVKVSDIEIV